LACGTAAVRVHSGGALAGWMHADDAELDGDCPGWDGALPEKAAGVTHKIREQGCGYLYTEKPKSLI
jgi:hypothetical protein